MPRFRYLFSTADGRIYRFIDFLVRADTGIFDALHDG